MNTEELHFYLIAIPMIFIMGIVIAAGSMIIDPPCIPGLN